jgi:hypothetical protein
MIMPEMVSRYEVWKKEGIEIYSIPVKHYGDKWLETLREEKPPWISVIDTCHDDCIEKIAGTSTPAIYILDKKKKIRSGRLMRPEDVDEAFRKLTGK